MKKMIFFSIFSLIFLIQVNYSKAPCDKWWNGSSYKVKMLNLKEPPINSNMPLDIIDGYKSIFDIHTHTTYSIFKDFLESQNGLTDTIKHLISIDYKLNDYDNILFIKYGQMGKSFGNDSLFSFYPLNFERDLFQFYFKNTPYPELDYSIIESDLIYHLKIEYTEYDKGNGNLILTTSIIDTIKGKVIPNYMNILLPDSTIPNDIDIESVPAMIGSKLIFEIEPNVNLSEVLPGREYVFFVDINPLCIDTSNNRESMYIYSENSVFYNSGRKLFPVINDIVIDSLNLTGMGISVDINEWKKALRNRINEIKNFPFTSIEVDEDFRTFNLSPNPASDYIEISYPPSKKRGSGGVSMVIYDVLGIEVLKSMDSRFRENDSHFPEGNVRIDVSALSPGFYFIRVGDVVRKFVKL